MIQIHRCENVAILGRGTIEAGGPAQRRLKIVHADSGKHVLVEDIVPRNTTG